jgi:hypothetical protein
MTKRLHEETAPEGDPKRPNMFTTLRQFWFSDPKRPIIMPGPRRMVSPLLQLCFSDVEPVGYYFHRYHPALMRLEEGRWPRMVAVGGGQESVRLTVQESMAVLLGWFADPDEFMQQAIMCLGTVEEGETSADANRHLRGVLAYNNPLKHIRECLPNCFLLNETNLTDDLWDKLLRVPPTDCVRVLTRIALGSVEDPSPSETLQKRAMDSISECIAPGRCTDEFREATIVGHFEDRVFLGITSFCCHGYRVSRTAQMATYLHHTILPTVVGLGVTRMRPAVIGTLQALLHNYWEDAREDSLRAVTGLLAPNFIGTEFRDAVRDAIRDLSLADDRIGADYTNASHLALKVLCSYVTSCAAHDPPRQPFVAVVNDIFPALLTLVEAVEADSMCMRLAMCLLQNLLKYSAEFRRIVHLQSVAVRKVLVGIRAHNRRMLIGEDATPGNVEHRAIIQKHTMLALEKLDAL